MGTHLFGSPCIFRFNPPPNRTSTSFVALGEFVGQAFRFANSNRDLGCFAFSWGCCPPAALHRGKAGMKMIEYNRTLMLSRNENATKTLAWAKETFANICYVINKPLASPAAQTHAFVLSKVVRVSKVFSLFTTTYSTNR